MFQRRMIAMARAECGASLTAGACTFSTLACGKGPKALASGAFTSTMIGISGKPVSIL
jgi:hypothetical protein